MAPIWIATEIGAYQREGLDAKVVYIDARIAIAALVAGEVDAVVISAPSVIPPVLSGANIAFIAGLHNKMIFSFHAQPDIQTPAELRGKIVGTNRPGTPADYGNRVALAKMGLKATDVQLMPLGSSGVMWQALQTRQVAGVTLAPPYRSAAFPSLPSTLTEVFIRGLD
jgi:ABC-type nitrate/sulfonate/bicarbonate transport system substrate-binding protein